MSKCKVFSFPGPFNGQMAYKPAKISQEKIKYEAVKVSLKITTPAHADRIIEIIESESDDYYRRLAFLETTYREIIAGADYSSCKTIKDISNVYAASMLKRLGY